jgi:hypothetical protein
MPNVQFATFRRFLWIPVVCAVVAGAAAAAYQHSRPKQYSATAELLFGANASLSQLLGLAPVSDSADPTAAASTDSELASLPVLDGLTASALGASVPVGGINVSVSEAGSSNLVNATATSTSPALAARIANEYADQFIAYTTDQQAATVAKGISALKRKISAGGSGVGATELGTLRNNLSELEAIAAVEPVDVSIVQTATPPSSASGPHTLKDGILGAVVGALIGLLAAIMAGSTDPRVHRLDTLALGDGVMTMDWDERVVPIPLLGLRERAGGPPERMTRLILASVARRPTPTDSRLFFLTREPAATNPALSVTVAWDLACGLAQFGQESSVLFMQFDHGSSPPDQSMAPEEILGWGDVLEGQASVSDAVRRVALDGRTDRHVDVLLPQPGHDPYVEDGPELRDLLEQLSASYRYVVVFAPSPEEFGATAPLVQRADVAMAVIQLGRSKRREVTLLVEALRHLHDGEVIVIGAREETRRTKRTEASSPPVATESASPARQSSP